MLEKTEEELKLLVNNLEEKVEELKKIMHVQCTSMFNVYCICAQKLTKPVLKI